MNDEDLLRRWQAGDAEAGCELVTRHGRALASFFRQRVRSDAVADLVQDTFMVLCVSRDRIRSHASFRAFVFGVARRKLLEHTRRRPVASLDVAGELSDPDPSATTVMDGKFKKDLAVTALRRLPLDDQVLLELHDHQDLKRRELAEIFDVPMGSIGGRVHRARRRLERIIETLSERPIDVPSTETSLMGYWASVHERWRSR